MDKAFAGRLYNKLARTNTPPIFGGLYVGIAHDDVLYDLRNDTATGAWVDVGKYASPESVLRNEVGMYAGIRWLRSGNATVTSDGGAGTVDTYSTNVVGYNALGRADTIAPSIKITGPFDVLGQYGPSLEQSFECSAELSGKAKGYYANPNRRAEAQGQSVGDEITPPRGRAISYEMKRYADTP
jgi:hypothetical protein